MLLNLFRFVVAFLLLNPVVHAKNVKQPDDILGKFKVIGRETVQTRAIVEVKKDNKGQYYFQLVELNKNARGYTETCKKCPGKFKDKKLLGMVIAWNLKSLPKKPHQYGGGFGIDPWSGKFFNGGGYLQGPKNNILYVIATSPETTIFSRKLRWLRVE